MTKPQKKIKWIKGKQNIREAGTIKCVYMKAGLNDTILL